MPLDAYPFSQRYGWVQDKYGLSWQSVHTNKDALAQRIVPVLVFVDDVCGRAEEAINFYDSVCGDSDIHAINRYGLEHAPDKEGMEMDADFALRSTQFGAMNSARMQTLGLTKPSHS